MPFYGVAKGRATGVFTSWSDCNEQIKGFPGAKFKKFGTFAEAASFSSLSSPAPGSSLGSRGSLGRVVSQQQPHPTSHHTHSTVSAAAVGGLRTRNNATVKHKGAGGYYAVAFGKQIGVYQTWQECKEQVHGCDGARYKKFALRQEALAFITKFKGKPCTYFARKKAALAGPGKKASTSPSSNGGGGASGSNDNDQVPPLPRPDDEFKDAPIVYTDGACSNNGYNNSCGGIGVYWESESWVGPSSPRPPDVSEPLVGEKQTNNRAEFQAAATAMRQAISHGCERIVLRTDSRLLINSLTVYIKRWRKTGWKTSGGSAAKNVDDLLELDALMKKVKVKFEYVAGHSGILGNEKADELARLGASKSPS